MDLERLIVLGLDDLRRAEADLEGRMGKAKRCRTSGACGRWSLISAVKDLSTRAERLEALMAALQRRASGNPVAA